MIGAVGAAPARPSSKGVFLPARDQPLYSVFDAGILQGKKTKKKGVLKGLVARSVDGLACLFRVSFRIPAKRLPARRTGGVQPTGQGSVSVSYRRIRSPHPVAAYPEASACGDGMRRQLSPWFIAPLCRPIPQGESMGRQSGARNTQKRRYFSSPALSSERGVGASP